MKKLILSILVSAASVGAFSQVTSDKQISLTGPGQSDRRIMNLGPAADEHDLISATEALSGVAIYPSVSGTSGSIVLSFSPPLSTFTEGQVVYINPVHSNAGPVTISADGLPAVPVHLNGAELSGGEMSPGVIKKLIYTGSAFEIQ